MNRHHLACVLATAILIIGVSAMAADRITGKKFATRSEVIAQHGAGRQVALVGHFPFIPQLRDRVGSLTVLELQPRGEDLPADAASKVIPQADVLAITGTALINHTFEGLMALRHPDALVLILGPSTPLSPLLFDHGVNLLSGSVVEDVDSVLRAVSQGANFRQVRRQGVRLVTMQKEETSLKTRRANVE